MAAATASLSAAPGRQRVPLALLDRMESSRSLDEENVTRLQASIAKWGLMQSPVVVANGPRFWLCIGNHRCEALHRNGEMEVECLVLPEGTPPQEALVRSLHENHVRQEECLPDLMKRLTALMDYHGCKSFAEGAKLAGISESKMSKIRFAVDRLSPQALSVIHDYKVGWSIAYEVARRASHPGEQASWLKAHVRGELPRDAMVEQSKQRTLAAKRAKRTPAQPRPVPIRGRRTVGGVGIQLAISPDTEGNAVADVLTALATQLVEHWKAGRPLSEFAF